MGSSRIEQRAGSESGPGPGVAILVKGYPRLSETFIARELLALQERGLVFLIVSLRHPTDAKLHDLNRRIAARVLYLPEYVHQEPRRVLQALWAVRRRPGFRAALRAWARDLRHDLGANRGRRFAQALVLAAELPESVRHLHVHYLHTPGSVGRYTAKLLGLPYSLSAHAKDIWTTPEREKREKLLEAAWTVTCTRANLDHLRSIAPEAEVALIYHGIDTARFRPLQPPSTADGRDPARPVRLVTVARAVPKKGIDILLRALAQLPTDLAWRWEHVGGGPLRPELDRLTVRLGLGHRIAWRGALTQDGIVTVLAESDVFCLPARIAADGDRDGLPNVLLEAMSMALPVVTTAVSAIPEAVEDGRTGVLVPPDDPAAFSRALRRLITDPARRRTLGEAARRSVIERFSAEAGYAHLAQRFGLAADEPATLPLESA